MTTHSYFHLFKFLSFSFVIHLFIIGAGFNHAFYGEKPDVPAQNLKNYEVEVLSFQYANNKIAKKINFISDHLQSLNVSTHKEQQISAIDSKGESYSESKQSYDLSNIHIAAPKGHNQPPLYPHIARQRAWEGKVVLAVEISSEGHVTQIKLDSSSGHSLLDSSAESAIKHWRFQPATQNGIPVESQLLVPILFRLKDAN